jgi:putative transposase
VVSGLPDVLYSDHGSDFTSTRIEHVCLDLHVRLIHSRVGVPQGRGKIERFYRTITTELLPHLPGFIPHGTGGTPVSAPMLTLHQLDDVLERFIVNVQTPLRDRDGTARAGSEASSRVCPHTRKTSTCCC